jgi:glycosyltransferase involved in cell wall biosynthesis
MITILTQSPRIFNREAIKGWIAKITNKKRGPHAVLESLKRGLTELNVPFQINPQMSQISDTVHVLSSINALNYAIDLKKKGMIKKILAGPNLVVTPNDNNRLILNPLIDIVLVPSEWVKNMYLSLAPQLAEKIQVWPAGVQTIKTRNDNQRDLCLVYIKSVGHQVIEPILSELKRRNINFKTISYGSFKHEQYLSYLTKAKFLIYLSQSESQGLALHEAWMHDVPTLVWNGGLWEYEKHRWTEEKISAPYLVPEAGLFFKNSEEFKRNLSLIQHTNNFTPNSYCDKNLSDFASTRILLKLI